MERYERARLEPGLDGRIRRRCALARREGSLTSENLSSRRRGERGGFFTGAAFTWIGSDWLGLTWM